ncbi:MAG: BamA/TamA family outer membrane protein, partial [Vicinamibacterales bacterium]
ALITLWIDPAEHQIVKYTFDNVWLDFLPGAWLLRMDDIRASMTMGQPFPGVWLPRGVNIHAGVTLANGSYEAGYERAFSQYRLAEVSTKIRVPKSSSINPPPSFQFTGSPAVQPIDSRVDLEVASGPFVLETFEQSPQEVIGEIRIHGNAFLTDKEVLEHAGIAVGQPLPPDGIDSITRRLERSGRFEAVEVRKRYRSLTSTTDVALVLVVHEKPGVRSATGGVRIPGMPETVARPVGRLRSKLMFLPIVTFADGYGFTYGGRMSTVDLLGIGERLSVPLTWGGTRRAALEFERRFETGPLTRVDSSVAIWNRENPRFDIRDQRVEVKGRAERVFGDLVRAGVDGSRSTISFGELDDRLWTIGTTLTLDTRLDPAFPGNAVLLGAGWTGMHFRELPAAVNRYTADARGYLRVFRQIVVAGRAQYTAADAALPPYERLLLGGSSSLRGFRTGSFDGDRMFVTSAELRAPITSVLSGARVGVTAFIDAGRIWNVGESRDVAAWHRGVGGGLFLIASIVRINVDVAYGLRTGHTRVHLSSGFTF